MATINERKAEVRRRLSIGEVIGPHFKLTGSASSRDRRAKCGFHGSNSRSFSVKQADSGDGHARCFGCGWSGDMFQFVMQLKGWPFMEALAELERMAGISAVGGDERQARGTVTRERAPVPRRAPPKRAKVEFIDMGRWIWSNALRDDRAVRRYFQGRGVPEAQLGAQRLAQFRYMAECPCFRWEVGGDPRKVLQAPAIVALVRKPVLMGQPASLEWVPVGVHVTFLNPEGTGTMKRRKPWRDEDDPWLPKRLMLGPTGDGCVLLGDYSPGARLWVGEGNETVLSGMALAGAADDDVGIATLSLGNLQGEWLRWRNGVTPLYAVQPDPDKPAFRVPRHNGPVVGLIDADMKPLRGLKHPRTGQYQGEPVVEHKGGPIVRRPITGAERAQICARLFVLNWRAIGCAAEARRPPAGQDFNDAIQERAQ